MATQRCSSIRSLRSERSPIARHARNRWSTVSSASRSGAASWFGVGSGIAIQISPPLAQSHADLAVIGDEVVLVDDNGKDLAAEGEALGLEGSNASGSGGAQDRHLAVAEVEA